MRRTSIFPLIVLAALVGGIVAAGVTVSMRAVAPAKAGPAASTCALPVAYVKDCGSATTCDGKGSHNFTTTASSTTVDCTDCAFVAGDVGKNIFCTDGSSATTLSPTTIASRVSATRITTTAAPTATGGGTCYYYTQLDDTALAAAYTAVSTSYTSTIKARDFIGTVGTIYLGTGGCVVSQPFYAHTTNGPNPNIVGESEYGSLIIMTPNYAGGDLITMVGNGGRLENFTITALGKLYTGQAAIYMSAVSDVVIRSVAIRNMGATTSSLLGAIDIANSSHISLYDVTIQNGSSGSNLTAAVIDGSDGILMVKPMFSNFKANLIYKNSGGRSPASIGDNIIGGLVDECTDSAGCMQLRTSNVNTVGLSVYSSTAGGPGVAVDATSTLYATDLATGRYVGTVIGDGLSTASGGKAYVAGSTIRANGNGSSWGTPVTNSGAFYDMWGNEYQRCQDYTCPTRTSAQAFATHQPIRK